MPTRQFLTLISLLLGGLLTSVGLRAQAPKPLAVTLEGSIDKAVPDSLFLFDFGPTGPRILAATPLGGTSQGTRTFTLRATVPAPGIYGLGYKAQGATEVILDQAGTLRLRAATPDLNQSLQFDNSPANSFHSQYLDRVNTHKMLGLQAQQNLASVTEALNEAGVHPSQSPQYQELLNELLGSQKALSAFQDSVAQAFPGPLGLTARLDQNPQAFGSQTTDSQYPDANAHFRWTFLDTRLMADPLVAFVPRYAQKVMFYLQQLLQTGTPIDTVTAHLERLSQAMPAGGRARRTLWWSAIGVGGSTNNIDLYLTACEQYLKHFPNSEEAPLVSGELKKYGSTRIGTKPPDITLDDPEGKPRSLSSMKGKVVLVDFWASWCGPCRHENPTVVKAYEKYHAKGFEIFSVSLDKNADAWKKAIATDQLTWPDHVSDLQGWQSEAARAWGVNSIPATFLLGPDGIIIAKNLRGPALEAKLAELLGGVK
jgi:thiol-disulfide isomerase/thioredoxin